MPEGRLGELVGRLDVRPGGRDRLAADRVGPTHDRGLDDRRATHEGRLDLGRCLDLWLGRLAHPAASGRGGQPPGPPGTSERVWGHPATRMQAAYRPLDIYATIVSSDQSNVAVTLLSEKARGWPRGEHGVARIASRARPDDDVLTDGRQVRVLRRPAIDPAAVIDRVVARTGRGIAGRTVLANHDLASRQRRRR